MRKFVIINNSRKKRSLKARCKFRKLKSQRLVVHRTSRHMYAQIISKDNFSVLVYASTLEKNIKKKLNYTGNKKSSEIIGKTIAKRALKKGIKKVSFDRSGFKYHGRIKSLANSARKFGLQF
ncbi:MAG: 50S ribosomal protein L18 [Buchnera aphidicola (Periphyllus lyropictus)]|uniref:50S ribosomal protein L18 n=1 Tax=Buchnera aphidicola TaxID=9 RepID=UPI001EC62A4A|nr:50S ribosomal protein L18 [Buchnera aphidicola]NIH16489.1 50S ribosomal protein L18 [Buchnera aphidicola (Periphyllus lyropictus)]USS94774.1 50S ribosomal protein L18 [Buchnera aphidicola (Periphyllus lyropictus)]